MSSVIVKWSGQCPDPVVQKNLCQKLKAIAELSHSYFGEETPIKYFDQVIEGNILINGSLVGENIACKSAEKIIHEYIEKRDEEVIALLDTIFETATEPEHRRDVFYAVKEAKLYGIEFCLYDPRDVDCGDNRISFVFLQNNDCPDLNGHIVHVEDKEQCQLYYNDIVKVSDWYLARPNLKLRYFCEKWIDRLMGWIKYFYVPNLSYWRYEEHSGYEEFSRFVDQHSMGEFEIEKARKDVLEILRKELEEEIEAWIKLSSG